MNITTIYLSAPHRYISTPPALSFADPYSDDTGRAMIGHTLHLLTVIRQPLPDADSYTDVCELWDAVESHLEGTGWRLEVYDSEVV